MFKACIFDLDGVIVDTAHYHYLAWKRLAKEFGVELTQDDNERLKGVSRIQSLDIVLSLANITLDDAEKEVLANKKNGWFVEYIMQMTPAEIFPGVIELVNQIKAKGMKVAIASSSKNAQMVLGQLKVQDLFEVIVDGSMIAQTKPDPEIFLLAASKLGIAPQQCLVFEDAEAGVEAALAAGMKCIGVGSPKQLNKANWIVSKTADFDLGILNELEAA